MRLACFAGYINEAFGYTNHNTSTKFHVLKPKKAMENFVNFTMFAKDREAAGAICFMKVQGNAGGEIDRGLKKDLVSLRTFHMEYDICYCKGRLPACFARGFGLQVGPYVVLRDQNKNEIEVSIEKKNGKIYFADGWSFLKTFYGILAGCWVTVIFANRHFFLIEVRNLYGNELEYPRLDPPLQMMLETQGARDYRNSFIRYGSNALFLPTVFCHIMVKQLTSDDVTSGVLKLNWLGLCQSAFPAEPTEITLIDYLGYPWKLQMEFGADGDMTCLFKGEWQSVCKARVLVEGSSVKFGVTEASSNKVMYLCPPQMLVLKTRLPPSTNAGANGACYRFEQYLWKN